MTVAVTNASDGPFVGNGTQTAFPFTFDAMTAGEVAVYVDSALVASGFTATVNAGSGGTVTFTTAPAVGKSIVIASAPLFTQDVSLANNGAFLPATIEQALDRGAARDIVLKRDLGRAIMVPLGQAAPAYADLAATFKGDPGGNAMAVGSFAALSGLSIPVGTDLIRTTEHRAGSKRGGAFYVADATVNAAFVVAHPGWSVVTANGRGFWLSDEQDVTFEMFGAYGDYGTYAAIPTGTDDYPQWLKAKDFLDYHIETHNNAYYKSVPRFRFGRKKYRFSQAISLDQGVYDISGTGPHALDRGGNTQLYFDSGQCGFIFQSWDTTGVSGTTTNTPKGSGGSRLRDMGIYACGGTIGGAEYGVLAKAAIEIDGVYCYNFGGHLFYIAADVSTGGNANCGSINNCGGMYGGADGVYFSGGDVNAWKVGRLNFIGCLGYGVATNAFLDTHIEGGIHTSGNGARQGPFWNAGAKPYAGSSSGGNRYAVIPTQETWASTHAPSGTTADNQGWKYVGAGGVDATFHPAWTSGMYLLAGGAGLVIGDNNKSIVLAFYMEGDQFQGFCYANRALILGGGFSSWTGGAQLNANDGRLWTPGISTTRAFQTGVEFAGQTVYFCNGGNIVYSFSLLNGRPHIGGLASYASNAAAVTAGLVQNDMYIRTDGTLAAVL